MAVPSLFLLYFLQIASRFCFLLFLHHAAASCFNNDHIAGRGFKFLLVARLWGGALPTR